MKNTKPIFSFANPGSDEDAIAGIAVDKRLNCAFVADEMGRAFLHDLRTWDVMETLSAADPRMQSSTTLTTCGVVMNDHEIGTSFSVASSDGVVRTWTKEEDDKEWYFTQIECEGVKANCIASTSIGERAQGAKRRAERVRSRDAGAQC